MTDVPMDQWTPEEVSAHGEGRPPVTDGPFAKSKDLIAGWMVIDVETNEQQPGLRR